MTVKHLFCSLMERLDGLEEKWIVSNKQKEAVLKEIGELRQISDEILDSWLMFEERLSEFHKEVELDDKHIPDEVADKILKEIKKTAQPKPASSIVSYLSGDVARIFRKGQGYYSLLMYPHASKHFKEVVQLEPDLEVARMFLAFSEMMSGSWDEADRHFQLLTNTTDQKILKATALNARGCMLAAYGKWDQALHQFERSIEIYPKLKDPIFNKALVLMELDNYSEAKQIWIELAKQDKEDWEVLLQLAACYIHERQEEQANFTLTKVINATNDPEILVETAKMFENLRQFGNAAVCFRLLLSQDPENPSAWHGLGWNLWHAEGLPMGLEYIRKAITMSPSNPDYQFSYGWILHLLEDYDKAEEVFRAILEQEGKYTLALAGLAQVYVSKQRWQEAEECCSQLIGEEHLLTKSLGYFQAGRMTMAKGNYEQAKEYFSESIRLNPKLKDNYLWLGLSHYLIGERAEALETWEQSY